MISLFNPTYISVDLVHKEKFRAKVSNGGITVVLQLECSPP